MRDFRKLKVWHKAHECTLLAYKRTRSYPASELYGMISQTRRAAVSISANIAEGCGRNSTGDFRRFLEIAFASASELEYHYLLARDLEYLPSTTASDAADEVCEVKKMLSSLILRLRKPC